jgi:hypothetical protein
VWTCSKLSPDNKEEKKGKKGENKLAAGICTIVEAGWRQQTAPSKFSGLNIDSVQVCLCVNIQTHT